MKKKYQHFIIRLTILSIAAGLLAFLLGRLLPPEIIAPSVYWLILLFFAVTATVHYILLRITALNPRKFVGYFMLATFLKLFIFLIVMVAYAFSINREEVLAFVLSFFVLYIIFTIFEVASILSQTKEKTQI